MSTSPFCEVLEGEESPVVKTEEKDMQQGNKGVLKRQLEEVESSSEQAVPSKMSKPAVNRLRNDDDEEMLQVGQMRYGTVRNFEGSFRLTFASFVRTRLRDTLRPSKKGISMTTEQHENFESIIKDIDEKIATFSAGGSRSRS
ncbi:transcriptional Coactivator p15 [Teladorsagia circumcincta]|uniref:Transcriptional Coactivator p15 n=1 Tax=Teladorsagia circumcincta TaxID=45464 RepID=A0A2G9UCS5_TELCI|nr:transcriptional Coactivator p15 [Teladorsagia circumcincta]